MAVVLLLTSCGGGEEALPSCTELFSGVVEAGEDGPCDDQGESMVVGMATIDCADGRTLAWNDYGWGYLGEEWSAHEGGELVAPDDVRTDC